MKTITIHKGSTGLNTRVDPHRLPTNHEAHVSDLGAAVNVKIGTSGEVMRADPFAESLALVAGHSMYSTGNVMLVADGTSLYQALQDMSDKSGLRSGMSGDQIDYTPVGSAIYYANGTDKGIVQDGTSYTWTPDDYNGPETDIPWQSSVPDFNHIAYHHGYMLGAVGSALYFSELGKLGLYNAENVIMFESDIVLISSVDGGVFVSDSNNTYFLSGVVPSEFRMGKPVLNYPAYEWSLAQQKVDAVDVGLEARGQCSFWSSKEGMVVGTPDGQTFNMTNTKIIYPEDGTAGASLVRGEQLISTLR